MSEKFSLKWNDFGSNVSKSFGKLRSEEYLNDVTLVGDDHTQLTAHKLVLSSCSEYFREIFKRNKHANTLLCLEGLSQQDIGNVLDYMYNGEVHIFQEELERFLTIAQRLRLEGLLDNGSEGEEQKSSPKETNQHFEERSSDQTFKLKSATTFKQSSSKTVSLASTNDNETSSLINDNLEEMDGGHFRCRFCGKDSTGMKKTQKACLKVNMRNHVETHIKGLSFSCHICGKEFRSKNSFSVHKSIFHKLK